MHGGRAAGPPSARELLGRDGAATVHAASSVLAALGLEATPICDRSRAAVATSHFGYLSRFGCLEKEARKKLSAFWLLCGSAWLACPPCPASHRMICSGLT